MLYANDNTVVRLLGVEHITWGANRFAIAPRPYAALAYRLKGTAVIEAGGRTCTVGPNDILYLPQELAYTAHYSDTDIVVFHFVTAQSDPVPLSFSPENPAPFAQLFLQAEQTWRRKAPGDTAHALSLLYRLMGDLLSHSAAHEQPSAFSDALALLRAQFTDPTLTVAQICAQAHISESYFRRLFSRQYRQSPVEYLIHLRLEQARTRLAEGATVEQAAYDSGFNDPKYFARTVKKHWGCTPRQLRTYGK